MLSSEKEKEKSALRTIYGRLTDHQLVNTVVERLSTERPPSSRSACLIHDWVCLGERFDGKVKYTYAYNVSE